jgi:hypothetical protein
MVQEAQPSVPDSDLLLVEHQFDRANPSVAFNFDLPDAHSRRSAQASEPLRRREGSASSEAITKGSRSPPVSFCTNAHCHADLEPALGSVFADRPAHCLARLTPRLEMTLVGLQGKVHREIKAQVRYAFDAERGYEVDAISIQSCDWWSLQLTSTACADYDAQCHPRQRDRPRPCPLRNDRRMAGLTSMDSSVCSSALALIACVGCHAHYRPGQRDRPIACPLRHDWRYSAPAENYRVTNWSYVSPSPGVCDGRLNNWTRITADRISQRRNPQRLTASEARRTLPWCQARSPSPRATFAQNISFTWTTPLVSISSDADRAKMRQRQTSPLPSPSDPIKRKRPLMDPPNGGNDGGRSFRRSRMSHFSQQNP